MSKNNVKKKKKISTVLFLWLALVVVIVFSVTVWGGYFSVVGRVEQKAWETIRTEVEDVSKSIEDLTTLRIDFQFDGVTNRKIAESIATYRRIGKTGWIFVCARGQIISSYNDVHDGEFTKDIGLDYNENAKYSFWDLEQEVLGEPSYVEINDVDWFKVVGVYPIKETRADLKSVMRGFAITEIMVFVVLFILVFNMIRRRVVKNVLRVNSVLSEITAGNLERKIDVNDTQEFSALSDGINHTVDRLKGFIKDAEDRLDSDLALASAIQISSLPKVFPVMDEYELFAGMHAAKEVGGDFFDYYHVGERTIGFLVADVSGKSIPGAMFMMEAKRAIRDQVRKRYSPSETLTRVNKELCDDNEAEMFVTAWLGYLNLDTGVVTFANAGHNPPLLIRDGKAEYIDQTADFVLAEFDFVEYEDQTLTLQPEDILYLYTDGITEGENPKQEQFGEKRLKETLSFGDTYPEPSAENGIVRSVCLKVGESLVSFMDGAEQFDDVTMLCVCYHGSKNNKAKEE